MTQGEFSFIEAPVYQGQKHFGVSLGPNYIQRLLRFKNYQFESHKAQGEQSQQVVVHEFYENLSYLVEREVRRNRLLFIAGGDHSLSIGSVQGLLRYKPNLKVLWIDAHADINTRESSLTHSFHGMPLSFLIGEDSFYDNQDWFQERLKPENLIYFGLRDLDLAEKKILEKHHIQHYTMADLSRLSRVEILKSITDSLQGFDVHVSLDADGFDPQIAPSTGVPVDNGLQFNEVQTLLEEVAECAQIISFEFVELNPQIYQQSNDVMKTAELGVDIFDLILKSNLAKKQRIVPQGLNILQKEVLHDFNDRFSY